MTTDTFHDLETFSPTPLKNGTHIYAEAAEVMLWAFCVEDGTIYVWDLVNNSLHWIDDLAECWVSRPLLEGVLPHELSEIIDDPEMLVWFQNGGMFDFVVLQRALPAVLDRIPMSRWRDTMVQAFAHSLPGSLDKLGEVLNLHEDKRKLKRGKALVQLFCKPRPDGGRATKDTHPVEWQEFIEYAGGDITTMREARRLMPSWNYKGKQIELWHRDLVVNYRGFAVDVELAQAAVRMAARVQAKLAEEVHTATDGDVNSATQRDAFMEFLEPLMAEYGVDLPDMKADTLERRVDDPDLPEFIKDLLRIRLQASMNSVSKFKTLLKGVSSDHRLRGTMQFRGAGRTGREAHRMFQPGNLPRPTLSHELVEYAIDRLKADDLEGLEMVFPSVMLAMSNTIRGAIVAGEGKKIVVSDLSNIEGRVAAWLAGEAWKLDAFRHFDSGEGTDLYILAYAKSFNVPPADVPKKGPERQIGKVEELMFQYGGGVGAWLTGAATYGIDLNKMTEQVWPVLADWAKEESAKFLQWLYGIEDEKHEKRYRALSKKFNDQVPQAEHDALLEQWSAAKLKARYGLSERTFIACDAIKRLWRTAHPAISSYWKEIEETVREAIRNPGVTLHCRKVKVRRDGAWLRCGLPSGRALCYPNPGITEDGKIYYTGHNPYNRQWGKVYTYGGKLFENWTQAVACDQLFECLPLVEDAGYAVVLDVHDEYVTEVPDSEQYTAEELACIMCSNLGWNEGLPLAAAGFETDRYKKE
ncbi:MAG: hypothetical protein IT189_12460 [Microbacteriaceae bacterium]|nr:hypothetical protein [Microbacteriaceae bacterium]